MVTVKVFRKRGLLKIIKDEGYKVKGSESIIKCHNIFGTKNI